MDSMLDINAVTATELRRTLEWELSLDGRDLRSHAWYHGAIPRTRAEEAVCKEYAFLVRDSSSQPGHYVLTCKAKGHPLHFVINKVYLQPDTVYERVQYQFEDETFDTVQDLITYYVGSGRAITAASGARIQHPVNRSYPLSFYASRYPIPSSRINSPAATPTANMTLGSFRHHIHPPRSSCLPSKKQRSQSLTPSEVSRISQEKCNSADGVIQSPLMTRSAGTDGALAGLKFSTHSLPRAAPTTRLSLSASASTLGRHCKLASDAALTPCSERLLFEDQQRSAPSMTDSPPPKPLRIPGLLPNDQIEQPILGNLRAGLQRVASYHTSGSDSGNGSGDSALSSAASGDICEVHRAGVIIKNPRYHMTASESNTTLKNFIMDYVEAEERLMNCPLVEVQLQSRFDLDGFQTLLLPVHENKPLDAQALRTIKMTLYETGSRILANHLTKTDFDIIFLKLEGNTLLSKLNNGIELCTLPHGQRFRKDLIERTECLKLLVAVTILTCADESERTETLNKWIEVAIDIKTALGNLFGFCGIVLGLCLPQIERLDSTWHMLRQKYTDAAFNFEAKLRPTLKNMNNCSNPQAPNTTIPHLLPLVLLLERGLTDFLQPTTNNQLSQVCINQWELNTHDFGLGTLLAHMEAARKYMDLASTYQRNAEIVLAEARMDELILDMFRTEFLLKFLWGSKGAYASSSERHSKFEQLLTVMAEKCCSVKSDIEV